MVKLLLLSDIHGHLYPLREVVKVTRTLDIEVAVVAGDLTHFSGLEDAVSVLKLISSSIETVLFVPGNCDHPDLLETRDLGEKGVYNIHGRVFEVQGYRFYGIGGSNITPFGTFIEWSEEELARYLEPLWDIDKEKLVVVTHAPIHGVMDEIGGIHVGSRVLREFIDKHGALLWITGHLHEYSGYKRIGYTVVVNPGPLARGFYGIAVLEDGEVEVEIYNIYESSKHSLHSL